jgi:hypothetical protein
MHGAEFVPNFLLSSQTNDLKRNAGWQKWMVAVSVRRLRGWRLRLVAGMRWTEDWKKRLQPPAPQRLHPQLARGHPTSAGTYIKIEETDVVIIKIMINKLAISNSILI